MAIRSPKSNAPVRGGWRRRSFHAARLDRRNLTASVAVAIDPGHGQRRHIGRVSPPAGQIASPALSFSYNLDSIGLPQNLPDPKIRLNARTHATFASVCAEGMKLGLEQYGSARAVGHPLPPSPKSGGGWDSVDPCLIRGRGRQASVPGSDPCSGLCNPLLLEPELEGCSRTRSRRRSSIPARRPGWRSGCLQTRLRRRGEAPWALSLV